MFRTLLTVICAIEAVAPTTLINVAERFALANPDDCEQRSWVTPGARLEGLGFICLMWWSDGSYSAFKKFVGVVGSLAFLFPRAYVDYGSKLAYTGESAPEWRPWVYMWTRIVALGYVLVGLKAWRGES